VDQVGATLGDLSPEKFLVLETLGQGAEGVVRKALYLPRNKLVALKTVDFFQRDRRQQVVKELDTFHKLRHPNVVECFGASFAEGSLTLVFEYMNRGSLQKAVKDYGPFGEEELRVIFAQVLQGLVHIHDLKQIHRDIKPDNVLINHRGEAKIGDFGILGRLKTEQEMLTTFVGTAVFMSPERIKVKSYTYAADIWSLGLTIFFCATGAMPFSSAKGGYWGLINEICEGEPPKLPPSFSPELRSLVDVCLQKDPARRWTAARLLEHPFFLRMPAAAGSAAAESTPASPPRTAAIDWSRSAASAAVIASELKREGAELIAERGGWALEARRRLRATEEIEALADALVREQYLKPGVDYKRSLFEQSKFAMLAAELGCSFEDVIGAFERRYEVLSRSRA
jgi:serine/threonine protein kinase